MSAFKNNPDPTFEVITEGTEWKAELTIHVPKKDRMGTRETRVRGPKRETRREAQLDGHELKRACVLGGTHAEAAARKRQGELLRRKWTREDLKDFEGVAKQIDELIEERKALDKLSRPGASCQTYKPVAAGCWSLCGPLMPRPDWGGPWLVYQRQDKAGKFTPHLYFNTSSNLYYSVNGSSYTKAAPPALPQTVPLTMRTAFHTKEADFSLVLSDLQRTGVLMKQRLDFLDLPAACMCLFDSLDSNDISFVAKNFHKQLFPKLSARHTEWEDFELRDVLVESLQELDLQWQESPQGMHGAGAAVALLVGSRLTAASYAGGAVVLVNLSDPDGAASAQLLTKPAFCSHATEEDRIRVRSFGASIDKDGLSMKQFPSLVERINHARNSFDVLGIQDCGDCAHIVKIYRKLSLQVHPDKCKDRGATEAFALLEKAKETLMAGYEKDPEGLNNLYTLFSLYYDSTVLRLPVCQEIVSKARTLNSIAHVCREDFLKAQQIAKEVEELSRSNLVEEPRTTKAPFLSALGLRSMKRPFPVVQSQPTAGLPLDLRPGKYAIALLSSTAACDDFNVEEIGQIIRTYVDKPRACAMALSRSRQCSSVITFATVGGTQQCVPPPAKKAKTEERVFLRHILVKFCGCKTDINDRFPSLDAKWRTRTLMEAEDIIVDAMVHATKDLNAFSLRCREVSDCKSGANPMSMCGVLGWVSRGHCEEKIDTAAFDLSLDSVSDVVQTDRGLQILRRVG